MLVAKNIRNSRTSAAVVNEKMRRKKRGRTPLNELTGFLVKIWNEARDGEVKSQEVVVGRWKFDALLLPSHS
jgi:hypothetical protein